MTPTLWLIVWLCLCVVVIGILATFRREQRRLSQPPKPLPTIPGMVTTNSKPVRKVRAGALKPSYPPTDRSKPCQ